MIDVYNMSAGWANLRIGYCTFCVSYLSDLKAELDDLFLDFDNETENMVHRIVLSGEHNGDLSLVAYLTYEELNPYLTMVEQKDRGDIDYCGSILNIVWQNIYSQRAGSVAILKFPYKKFLEEYKKLTKEIKKKYVKEFLCPISKTEYQKALLEYDNREEG